jgi:threonine/homoserine/homoserine lactone efflux protein
VGDELEGGFHADEVISMPSGMNNSLWLYFLLVFGVIALPGMDMAFVVTSSMAGGARGAVAAIGGIVAGGVVHVITATIGITALLAAFPHALKLLVLAGAAYMAWMGVQFIRARPAAPVGEAPAGARRGSVFRFGAATCLVNPKAYAFMLAVFPSFLHSDSRPLALQALALSVIAASTQVAVYGTVAFAALQMHRRFGPGSVPRAWMQRAVGAVMVVSSVILARGWLGN